MVFGGKTTITVESFMPLCRASPDRACRSLRVHVPSLSSFRCQLTFIFLHLLANVEALPGTRDFHYLRTTADMMLQSSAFPLSAVIHWPPPGKQHYPRLGNYWELLPPGALLSLAAALVVGHVVLPQSGGEQRPSLAMFPGKPFFS